MTEKIKLRASREICLDVAFGHSRSLAMTLTISSFTGIFSLRVRSRKRRTWGSSHDLCCGNAVHPRYCGHFAPKRKEGSVFERSGGFTEMHHQSEEKVGAIRGTRAENGVDFVYVCW